ncbi:MAG: anti-sigma factor family protein [Verrucomicrobiales bacterium]
MKNKLTAEDLVKLTDGFLDEEERGRLEAAVSTDAAAQADLRDFQAIGDALRAEVPVAEEPPYPDFFNSRILQAIEQESTEEAQTVAAAPSFYEKLSWWLLPVTAGALALAFVAGMNMPQRGESQMAQQTSEEGMPTLYLPLANLEANVVNGTDEGVNLIVLDGLNDIPDDVTFDLSEAELETPDYTLVKHTDDLL